MILNLLILLFGILFLIYGIKCKVSFMAVAGVVLLVFALISTGMDLAMAGEEGFDISRLINYRLPFVLS